METLRTSSYMIPVKLESEEGKYMLIHGYTGAVDIVSENLLMKIKQVESQNNFAPEILQTLLKRGYITTKTQDEEYNYVTRISQALIQEHKILNASFTWVISYNCNFRCPYCFEDRKNKDGKERLTFTKEQADIAFDAQELIQPHKKLRSTLITLYGGEPLLAENKDVVNYIVQEGNRRGYKFSAITNGYEIDQFENILGENGIYRLQITVDGLKEIHNKRRIHYKNHDTFDKIIDNIELALNKGVIIIVRMNSDGKNIEQCNQLKSFFEEKHFFDYPHFYFYIARLRDYYDITLEEHHKLNFISPTSFLKRQEEINFTPFTIESGYYKDIKEALSHHRSIPFRAIACKAQSNAYVLDPLGNIYPCWETVGKKEQIKGCYSKNGIKWNTNVCNMWENTNVLKSAPCKTCKYVLFCAGGCPYHRILQKNEQQCTTFQKIFSIAINRIYKELYKKESNKAQEY